MAANREGRIGDSSPGIRLDTTEGRREWQEVDERIEKMLVKAKAEELVAPEVYAAKIKRETEELEKYLRTLNF